MPPKTKKQGRHSSQSIHKDINLELLPSISRSGGGDNAEGDSLKDHKVQEQYMKWIDGMVLEHEKKANHPPTQKDKLMREDIVRCFRKLREGVIASSRKDKFAAKVYESSLFLAAAYGITDQVTTIAGKMVPLETLESLSSPGKQLPSEIALLLILLHHFILATKNPWSLRWIIAAISNPRISSKIADHRIQWLRKLRILVISQNYYGLSNLLADDQVELLLTDILSPGLAGKRESAGFRAIFSALLRTTRDATWNIVRSAYREESETWITSVLTLAADEEHWLSDKQKVQEALLVSNSVRRWKLYRPKPAS